MSDLKLPPALLTFLRAGRQLEYDSAKCEPGAVGLKELSVLTLGVVWVDSDESSLADESSDATEEGYYEIPAVSLTGACATHDPEFILLWLPNEGMYGTWDCDHWDLQVFRGKSWNDIVADPIAYIGAQWDGSQSKVMEPFKPIGLYELKKGRPV